MNVSRTISVSVFVFTAMLFAVGALLDHELAVQAYFFGLIYAFTIVLGALFLLMIGHATNAGWFVPLRRPCERVIGTLPLLAVSFLPVLIYLDDLYTWTHWQELPPWEQEHVRKKLAWLNSNFFVLRSIFYLSAFVAFAELLRRWSRAQDASSDRRVAQQLRVRLVRTSIAGLVVLSLVMTFAAWDWLMSLEPVWHSNLYGVYVFSGSLVSGLGLIGVMLVIWRRGGNGDRVRADHFHALGRLQLAMLVFWAYIGWCHVLQHWIANLPAEALWYQRRWHGGWQLQGVALIVLHFAIPFFLLLSRRIKRHAVTFGGVSLWLVCVHAIDVHYLALPPLRGNGPVMHWLDAIALVGIASGALLFGMIRDRALADAPTRDPLYERGLAYEAQS